MCFNKNSGLFLTNSNKCILRESENRRTAKSDVNNGAQDSSDTFQINLKGYAQHQQDQINIRSKVQQVNQSKPGNVN